MILNKLSQTFGLLKLSQSLGRSFLVWKGELEHGVSSLSPCVQLRLWSYFPPFPSSHKGDTYPGILGLDPADAGPMIYFS